MRKYIILVAFVLFCASATVCKPELLAANTFLKEFLNHEILALLAIILAITFASVANIHLSLNRITLRAFGRRRALGSESSEPVRKEINSNAWTLFGGFIVCILSLIVKGIMPENIYIVSAMNGVALTVLLLSVLVFYDIYRVIFAVVGSPISAGEEPDDGSSDEGSDFDSDVPPTT